MLRKVSHELNTKVIPAGGAIRALPRAGVIGAELVAEDHEGKTLIEFVLPDRFPGGPHVPFEASWWSVQPGEVTPEDQHEVQEVWFVARGSGELRLGGRQSRIEAGQAVYVPSSTSHLVRATGTEDLHVFSVWW